VNDTDVEHAWDGEYEAGNTCGLWCELEVRSGVVEKSCRKFQGCMRRREKVCARVID
jgi:hypothetical protein